MWKTISRLLLVAIVLAAYAPLAFAMISQASCCRQQAAPHCPAQSAATASMAGMEMAGEASEPALEMHAASCCPQHCCSASREPLAFLAMRRNEGFVASVMAMQSSPRAIVFVSSGFSSHTDRGPPALL